jgi:hypothetical protein
LRRYVPPKHLLTFTKIHVVISEAIEHFITTAMRASDPIIINKEFYCQFKINIQTDIQQRLVCESRMLFVSFYWSVLNVSYFSQNATDENLGGWSFEIWEVNNVERRDQSIYEGSYNRDSSVLHRVEKKTLSSTWKHSVLYRNDSIIWNNQFSVTAEKLTCVFMILPPGSGVGYKLKLRHYVLNHLLYRFVFWGLVKYCEREKRLSCLQPQRISLETHNFSFERKLTQYMT